MIDYASTAQEILETPPWEETWERQRIQDSDAWLEVLEKLNLDETRKAPMKLRDEIAALANDVEVKVGCDAGARRETQALLDLVFDIQEELFNRGGYRRLRDPEEEDWPS